MGWAGKFRAALALGAAFLLTTPTWAFAAQTKSTLQQHNDGHGPTLDDLLEGIDEDVAATVDQIDELLTYKQEPDIEQWLLAARGLAHFKLGYLEKGTADFNTAISIVPANGLPERLRFIGGVIFDHPQQSSIALDQLLLLDPSELGLLSDRMVYNYLRDRKDKHTDDQRIALARAGFGSSEPGLFVEDAIGILLDRRDFVAANEFATKVNDVALIQQMLVNRRYEPIWKTLERESGKHMERVGATEIGAAKVALEKDPSSLNSQLRLVRALANNKRLSEMDAASKRFLEPMGDFAATDEDGAWLVNEYAQALFDSGRAEEADDLYARLIARHRNDGWVISMVINRLELLVRKENYHSADRLMPETAIHVVGQGSDYAKQLVRRLQLCTLAGLGRISEIAAVMEDFRAHANDAPGATVEGFMCTGDFDSAKTLAISTLSDPDRQGEAIASLQKEPLGMEDPSAWTGYWAKLRDDPEVEAAFQKAGRDLPGRFRVGK